MRGQRRTPRKGGRTYRSARRGALEGASGGGRRPGDRGHDKLSHLAMPPSFDAQILSRPSPPCGEVRWGRLTSLERRFPLLCESFDPLVRVIADENAPDRLPFERQPH